MANVEKYPNWIQSKWMTDIRPDPYFKAPYVVDKAMVHHTGTRRLVIQAGSHIGIWPAKLSDYFDQVVAFEPVAENYLASMHNMQATNVLVIPACLGAQLEPVRVSDSTGFGGSARISTKANTFPTLAVPVAMLPIWVQSQIDAMFLDVEGYELEVLKGAVGVIESNHPTIVVEENNKSLQIRSAGEIASYLGNFGYTQAERYGDDLIFIADRQ